MAQRRSPRYSLEQTPGAETGYALARDILLIFMISVVLRIDLD
jgi:hypothetical protein